MSDVSSERPLRVLHLTSSSNSGGVSRYLHDLGRAMQGRGHEVTFAGWPGKEHPLFERAGLPWLEVPLNGGPGALCRSAAVLHRWLREHPVDVLHGHYRKSMLVARWLGRWHRIPTLFTLHATDVPMSPIVRAMTAFGDHVHVPSERAREWLMEAGRVPSERITKIRHGVDLSAFPYADRSAQAAARQRLDLPADALIAGAIGRIVDQKNPLWIVDLAEAARDALPAVRFLMMGGGAMKNEVAQAVRQRGLEDRVILRPYGDSLPAYQAIDILLLPSAYEGFPLGPLEAMSVGRPVLRTAAAGAEEQIEPGRTGWIVPIDRERFVAEALEVLRDREALWRVGEAASRFVGEALTHDRQVEATLALYRRLCGAEPGPQAAPASGVGEAR